MASWAEFEASEPDLAGRVKERFAIRKHKTLATLRRDGSPRISGIEVEIDGGEVLIGMMPGSVKLRDLERDPRLALHSPTEDPPAENPRGWSGEAKISGRALPVVYEKAAASGGAGFRVDIAEVVLTHLNDRGDRLVVESWQPGRGFRRIERS